MFPGESKKPEMQKFLDSLKGSLSDTGRAQFENQSPEDPFLKDAMEGLQEMENREDLPKVVNHLNQQLRHHLSHHKSSKIKKGIRYGNWIYWSIGVILLMALVGFLVLRLLLKH